jgi:hypothetical protein
MVLLNPVIQVFTSAHRYLHKHPHQQKQKRQLRINSINTSAPTLKSFLA